MWTDDLDPTIFSLGSLEVRWYGLMYVVGFLFAGKILATLSKEGFLKISIKDCDNFLTSMMIGMFFGARLTYVFVYNWDYYSKNLTELLAVWHGGLSFHGAILGFVVTILYWAKKRGLPFLQLTDSSCLAGTLGIFFGRIGNFINGELYGRQTDSLVGIIFPAGGPYPRHPSQLYEAFLEGLILFSLLWVVKKRVKIYGLVTATFLCGYAFFRYFIEFFREADSQLGYYFGGTTTMGQILCIIMFGFGCFFIYLSKKKSISLEN